MAQSVTGRMRSVERQSQAAQPVPNRNREDWSHQTIGKPISCSRCRVNVIWLMQLCGFKQRVARVECLCCVVPRMVRRGALKNMIPLEKDACRGEPKRFMNSLDELLFNLTIAFGLQDGVAEAFSCLHDRTIE